MPAGLVTSRSMLAVALAAVALGAFGCNGGGAGSSTTSVNAPDPVRNVATDGPVTLTLSGDRPVLDVQQHLIIEIEAVADRTVTVRVDDYGLALAEHEHRFEFRVIRRDEKPAALQPDGGLKWWYRFELEFILPGYYDLPGARVTFHQSTVAANAPVDNAAAGATVEERTLGTEPLHIVVEAGAVAELSPDELRTVALPPPMELPSWWSRWWWTGILAAAALAFAAMSQIRRSARRAIIVPPLTPEAWARLQLSMLLADDLVRKGQVQQFYYRITAIVRGFIERRFDILAAEMTTQEFLSAVILDPRFSGDLKRRLRSFLEACDLVKYALHHVGEPECNEALHAAMEFVEHGASTYVISPTLRSEANRIMTSHAETSIERPINATASGVRRPTGGEP